MKKVIQISIFIFILLSLFFFNKKYLTKSEKIIKKRSETTEQLVDQNENNIIKNLKYKVNFNEESEYTITADLSEIINSSNQEIVKMYIVEAIILDKNKVPLIINSDNAIYNNFNYNTQFRDNVSIIYLNNKILSDKLDLNFENNTIKIFENVRYYGSDGTIHSDNIKIDLISKKVDIYMNNDIDKVELNKN